MHFPPGREILHCMLTITSEALFVISMAWKCLSLSLMRPSDQGYLASVNHLFGILAAWKSDSSSVMRPSDEGYMASIELLFTILATWKIYDSSSACDLFLKGTWLLLSFFRQFGCFKMQFVEGCSRVPGYRWAPLQRLGGLKMRFLQDRGTLHSKVPGILLFSLRNSSGLKMWFFKIMRLSSQGYLSSIYPCSAFCWPENSIHQG
jgi:hypothetical protein